MALRGLPAQALVEPIGILPDEVRVRNIATLVGDGFGAHVCLSHDSNCGAWLGRPILAPGRPIDPATIPALLPDWTPTHLFERVIPKMREAGIPDAAIAAMTDENPARWFSGAPIPR